MADSERRPAPRCWAARTSYWRTRKGFLLLTEIMLCLVILICFSASTSGYSSLSVIEMILAAVFFVIYMCDLHTKMPFINWPWSDFFPTLIAAILYLFTSIFVLVEKGNTAKIIAGVLGLIATLLFGYDASFTFPLLQQRHTAAPTAPTDGPV
ncbi:Proteolipid protein 2 [Heterocephalus glaber]|uniref:Proteolipid protein 2 n=1 Tax=Heterocephalus glaber TaxID=10181 RepID=G5B0Q7_HETGA|nr:Proteolipid protein 2 [Heterocephalus glaber]